MELAVVVALAVLALAALAHVVRRCVFRGTDLAGAMGTLFVGLRADPWPQGVQEEDRDRPWGALAEPQIKIEKEIAPPLVRVRPAVRIR